MTNSLSSRMRVAWFAVAAAVLAATSPAAFAQNGLTHLAGPQGGQIVFGRVIGPTSPASAMGIVLSGVHAQFGARPDVGRAFELKGSDSVAVHFSVAPSNHAPVAGMVIVTPTTQGAYEAAVVSDDRSRLPVSFNPMLQALFSAWHPQPPGDAAGPGPTSGPAVALRPFTLPDRTASVGLPDGFRVMPNSAGGSIYATGPNGERVALGDSLIVIDTGTAKGRQLQQQAMGALRNTSYARNLYYPFGQPLGRTFVDLNQMQRRLFGMAPAAMRVTGEEPMGGQGGSRCAHLRGDQAPRDGLGPTVFDTVFCVTPPDPYAGSWLTVAYTWVLPAAQVDTEHATMAAIVASFREDRAAIQRQANQIAAPAIAQIHEIGRLATQRAADADATRISMRRSYEARSAVQDRSSAAFSNYIRDQTVVVDRDTGTHETVWNRSAESMVKNDPRRFGYVDTPNFWKGVDY